MWLLQSFFVLKRNKLIAVNNNNTERQGPWLSMVDRNDQKLNLNGEGNF